MRGPLRLGQERELRRLLYGLHAVIRLHFKKEEELYLPLIEQRLSPNEAQEMLR